MQLIVLPPLPRTPTSFARVMALVTAGIGPRERVSLAAEPHRDRGFPGIRWQLQFSSASGQIYRQVVVLEEKSRVHALRLDAPVEARAHALARMSEACAAAVRRP